MNKFFKKIDSLKFKLSLKMSLKFLFTIILFCVAMAIALLLSILIINNFYWYADDPLYKILNFIATNLPVFLFIGFVFGVVLIFLYYYQKSLSYLDYVLLATEQIYNHKNDYIQLPPDLRDIEIQLNKIKSNVQQNEKIAKEAEQRKNDLVVYLAHDLKTPLTSVIGYLSLLKDEPQISKELQEKYISIALNKSQRLETLITEFFEITRFNLSHIPLEIADVNITRMMQQFTFEFLPILKDKNLQCKLDIPPDIFMKCDADKFQRVLDNILRNAINYSFEDTTIDITVTQTENGTSFVFLNHGYTISKEKLSRIFEQFYRIDESRSTQGGAGLGLAIAKEIVLLHKGNITAQSEDEKITIRIFIPSL